MSTKCFSPLRGKRIRVTELDDCCNVPVTGSPDGAVATDGFISVSLTSEIEEGTEIITRKADGSLCVNDKAADSFKRFTVEIEFCDVDPDLLSITTNGEAYLDWNGDTAGIVVPEGTITSKFSLELWVGVSGNACATGVSEASGYLLLPCVTAGVLGDLTIDGENAISFTMTGAFTNSGNGWGVGPYDVLLNAGVADRLPTPLDPGDHLLLVETGVAPPPSACGRIPVPAP